MMKLCTLTIQDSQKEASCIYSWLSVIEVCLLQYSPSGYISAYSVPMNAKVYKKCIIIGLAVSQELNSLLVEVLAMPFAWWLIKDCLVTFRNMTIFIITS